MAGVKGRSGTNKNKDKPFREALRLEIKAAQDNDDPRSLRRIARALLTNGAEGDVQAIREIADRIDGKVPQAIGGTDELPEIKGGFTWQPPSD